MDDIFVTLQEGSDDIFLTIEDSYILPTASATIKGGIKVGSGLSITGGVLSATALSQVQSDFAQTDSNEPDFIKNKPSIPSNTSDLINDSGFITIDNLEPYVTTSGLTIALSTKSDTTHNHSLANLTEKSYNSLTDKPTIPDELKDLTDDATHRTVTDIEKTTWNNKLSSFTEADPVFTAHPAHNVVNTGDGTQYLSDDGTYKVVEGGVTSVNGETGDVVITIPTATSDLTNDSGFITSSSIPDISGKANLVGGNTFTGSQNFDDNTLFVDSVNNRVGVRNSTPLEVFEVKADEDEDINYIAIIGDEDKTRGFQIDSKGEYKWANYIYAGEDGDTQYFASGNSGRDILTMQSGGRIGLNVPTLLANIEILRIVQTGSNTYATVTCEAPHKLSNNTEIIIEGATNLKFNGSFIITNVTTMTFRLNGLEVGAVSEEPTDAVVTQETTIPASLAIYPQYFDGIYSFDEALNTGAGAGYTNITANMRTSFGTADTILPITSGSYLYIGKNYPWRATNFNIETASIGASTMVVEYSNKEGGWTILTTSATSGNGLVDGTSKLKSDGNIAWNLRTFKNLWSKVSIQTNPAPHYTQELFWIRISLTGTVTTAPTAKAIGNHGIDRFAIYTQAGDVSPVMSVDSMGRVGFLPAELEGKYTMGTLAGLQSSKFEVVAEDGLRSDFLYYVANDASGQHPAIIFARSGGKIATKTPVASGMDLGGIYAEAYDGSQFRDVGKILFESAKLATSGDASGRICFFTRNATTTSSERMRITEAGNVGIGTTSPTSKLQVKGAGTTTGVSLLAQDSSGATTFQVQDNGTITAPALNRCGFSAFTSNTAIPAVTWTTAVFSTEQDDTHNAFNGSVFTVPTGKGGLYQINAVYAFLSVSDGSMYIVALDLNNTGSATHLIGRGISGGTNVCGAGGSLVLNLSAGATIRLKVYCSNATVGIGSIPGYCSFSATKLIV